nr:reverse transcriptase domain-containing protein [Tanacetum cinerariifolium]
PPPAFIKAVEEIYVTCGAAHPYYQCLAVYGNSFMELRDNIQGYVSAAQLTTIRFHESFHEAWDQYKDLLHACPHHGFTELHQLDTFYNALNPADQDSLNSAAGGNLSERHTQDVLTIIENKFKVHNS